MQETCRPVSRTYKLEQILFCTFDSRKPDPTYTPTLEEALRIFRHSEWAQWRDCPTLYTDPFIQSLFADWCADNGFHLQEAAVRERLSRG